VLVFKHARKEDEKFENKVNILLLLILKNNTFKNKMLIAG
jgi:hypothetical protein